MDALTRSALAFLLAIAGLFAAWYAATSAAQHGAGLWWQLALGAAAYMGAIALLGTPFGLEPATAVHDTTHTLVVVVLTTIDVTCALVLALCGLRALLVHPNPHDDAPAALPDASTYAKTA